MIYGILCSVFLGGGNSLGNESVTMNLLRNHSCFRRPCKCLERAPGRTETIPCIKSGGSMGNYSLRHLISNMLKMWGRLPGLYFHMLTLTEDKSRIKIFFTMDKKKRSCNIFVWCSKWLQTKKKQISYGAKSWNDEAAVQARQRPQSPPPPSTTRTCTHTHTRAGLAQTEKWDLPLTGCEKGPYSDPSSITTVFS